MKRSSLKPFYSFLSIPQKKLERKWNSHLDSHSLDLHRKRKENESSLSLPLSLSKQWVSPSQTFNSLGSVQHFSSLLQKNTIPPSSTLSVSPKKKKENIGKKLTETDIGFYDVMISVLFKLYAICLGPCIFYCHESWAC
jgi:hypothetical protein